MHAQHEHPNGSHQHDQHSGHTAHAQVGGADLIVSTRPDHPRPGQTVALELMVHHANGQMVTEFESVHEHKVHLIIVRDDLEHFAHIHPTVNQAGKISATHRFATAGTYWLYAEFKHQAGHPSVAVVKLEIAGDREQSRPLVPNVPGPITNGMLTAAVSVDPRPPGVATGIAFDLTDSAGDAVNDLQPWMGEFGHLVLISADGQHFVHSHFNPKASRAARVAFEIRFPAPGIYKGWGQFKRAESVQILPFVIGQE